MGESRLVTCVLSCVLAAGCLPRPVPAQPPQPQPPPQQPQPQAMQPPPMQPPPPQQPAVQPVAPPASPTTMGAQQPPPMGAPQQPQNPYAQQSYTQAGYVPAGQGGYYPPPPPPLIVSTDTQGSRRLHDGAVIADFAIVGTLGAFDILDRQDVDRGNLVTLTLMAGIAGGAGVGYLLGQNYDVDAGTSHSTSLGLALGIANGALLIEPTGWSRRESVLNFLFLGSAAGAAGGFIYGQHARLTAGQATFMSTTVLLGTATAALGAIVGSTDGAYGNPENLTLAAGIDGGALVGALIAPSLDWSPRRARIVMMGTIVGAFAGGMLAGLIDKPDDGETRSSSGDVVAAAMTAGMWGGFGLGIMMTKDDTPDPKYAQPIAQGANVTSTTIAPLLSSHGSVGVSVGGWF